MIIDSLLLSRLRQCGDLSLEPRAGWSWRAPCARCRGGGAPAGRLRAREGREFLKRLDVDGALVLPDRRRGRVKQCEHEYSEGSLYSLWFLSGRVGYAHDSTHAGPAPTAEAVATGAGVTVRPARCGSDVPRGRHPDAEPASPRRPPAPARTSIGDRLARSGVAALVRGLSRFSILPPRKPSTTSPG